MSERFARRGGGTKVKPRERTRRGAKEYRRQYLPDEAKCFQREKVSRDESYVQGLSSRCTHQLNSGSSLLARYII